MDTICGVYLLTNRYNSVLYVGVTTDLENRLAQHFERSDPNSFTNRYNLQKLVFFEEHNSIEDAIIREKQIKSGSRAKKILLIESHNPSWMDLSPSILGYSSDN